MCPHQNAHADLAAALRCLDDALANLAQYATIQVIDCKSARIAFYTPHPIRADAKQVHPGIHRLNWPDRRRWRSSSHTFRHWVAELEARELNSAHTRFHAVALFDRTLTFETEHRRTLHRWMRSLWQHHKTHSTLSRLLTRLPSPHNQASQESPHQSAHRAHRPKTLIVPSFGHAKRVK